jgi:hypothetical protein
VIVSTRLGVVNGTVSNELETTSDVFSVAVVSAHSVAIPPARIVEYATPDKLGLFTHVRQLRERHISETSSRDDWSQKMS